MEIEKEKNNEITVHKEEVERHEDIIEEQHTLLNNQIELYTMLETAWHLCEILFIETLPLGCLIQQLLEWVSNLSP